MSIPPHGNIHDYVSGAHFLSMAGDGSINTHLVGVNDGWSMKEDTLREVPCEHDFVCVRYVKQSRRIDIMAICRVLPIGKEGRVDRRRLPREGLTSAELRTLVSVVAIEGWKTIRRQLGIRLRALSRRVG